MERAVPPEPGLYAARRRLRPARQQRRGTNLVLGKQPNTHLDFYPDQHTHPHRDASPNLDAVPHTHAIPDVDTSTHLYSSCDRHTHANTHAPTRRYPSSDRHARSDRYPSAPSNRNTPSPTHSAARLPDTRPHGHASSHYHLDTSADRGAAIAYRNTNSPG